jgi:hypothetical protein
MASESFLLSHPVARIFPLLDGKPLQELVDDIRVNGLREPIVLHEDKILDGPNRYRACIEAGIEPRIETYNGRDPLGYVVSLNLKRRHLNESQRAMVAARIATLRLGGNQHSEGLPIGRASELLNVSKRTTHRAREVLDDGGPELAEAVDRGEVAVSLAEQIAQLPKEEQREVLTCCDNKAIVEAYREIRAAKLEEGRLARLAIAAAASRGNCPLDVSRRYPVIYADPPWRYEHPPMSNSQIENHYPSMTCDEICALPVGKLTTDDAILYLWATAPMLPWCMRAIESWGFLYRTNLVWIKDKIGMGFYARNQHELLLIARRGNFPPPAGEDRISSVIVARRGKHSEKPEAV